jgi:hypothetical protein
MFIVASVARQHPHYRLDLEGEAALAVSEAVDRVRTGKFQMWDDNITPYICTRVRFALKLFMLRTHFIQMPVVTMRRKIKNGEKIKLDKVVQFDTERVNETAKNKKNPKTSGRFTGVAKPAGLSPEFKEIMDLCIRDEEERTVVELRFEGYTFREIDERLGRKVQEAAGWFRSQEIFDRFRKRFKDKWSQ